MEHTDQYDLEKLKAQSGDGPLPHVIFKLQESQYAISSTHVLHIQKLEQVIPIVGTGPFVRGTVLFNGMTVPVYELRTMFGMSDLGAELDAFMQQRITDHENWVAALEASIENNTNFTLTTDPHQCAFGKWLDNFHSDNSYLTMHLHSVDEPHKAVHQTGETVKRLMAAGNKEAAKEAVEEMKNTHFKRTLEILSQVSDVYKESSKEMLVIIQVGDAIKGLIVDFISGIGVLNDFCEMPPNMEKSQYISQIAKQKRGNTTDIIQILDPFML
ncbi:MAG: CZB domain-containing protein [Christensenellaceae bacterium]|jgi:chemotaxis signal transduction protein